VILDTDGLSAIADGDAALEPILRKAAKVAVPQLCWANIDMEFSTHATGSATKNG